MADTLDLLGVIGTWAAVLLAIIALAGIIPAYLLYRRSQTDEYEAISLIDDKPHEYISKGIALLPRRRFFRSVRVPNLVEPPKLQAAAQDEPDANRVIEKIERRCNILKVEGRPSITSWINFADVLRAYGISAPRDDKLKFEGTQALLRVHRSWILLLGLIDRYGHREYSGLFADESSDPQWSAFSSDAVYGLSGLLERIRPGRDRVCFRMHSATHMQRIPDQIPARDMSPRDLFFLYLGYLPAADGSLYCSNVESDAGVSNNYVPRSFEVSTNVFYRSKVLEPNGVPVQDMRLATEMGVRFPTIRRLELYQSVDSLLSGLGWLDGVRYRKHSQVGARTIWVHPSDAQSMVLALLQLEVNSQSCLCGDGLKKFFDQLRPKGDMKYLDHMLNGGLDVLQINAADKAPLKAALEQVVRHTAPFTESRSWASALERLDMEVRQLVDRYKVPEDAAKTMAILALTDDRFMSWMTVEPRHLQPQAVFTISDTEVCVPAISQQWYHPMMFSFNFASVFRRHSGDGLTIPLWQVMLASLHGYVRWHMWSTVFSTQPLSALHNKLDRIVYLSPHDLPDHQEDV